MIDAYQEFITENSERTYPFVEDCSLLDEAEDRLSDGVVLDFKGFHRAKTDIKMQLGAILGPSSSGTGSFTASSGSYVLWFLAGKTDSPLLFKVEVPADSIFPFRVRASVADPNYAGVLMGMVEVVVGAAILEVGSSDTRIFDSTAVIEPALVVEAYTAQVDQIKIIHQEGDDEFVGGDLRVSGGYNVEVLPSTAGIRVSPSPGAGSLGRFTGSLLSTEQSKCRGVVLSIGGSALQEGDVFHLIGDKGIEIVNLPDEHKVQIKVAPQKLDATIC